MFSSPTLLASGGQTLSSASQCTTNQVTKVTTKVCIHNWKQLYSLCNGKFWGFKPFDAYRSLPASCTIWTLPEKNFCMHFCTPMFLKKLDDSLVHLAAQVSCRNPRRKSCRCFYNKFLLKIYSNNFHVFTAAHSWRKALCNSARWNAE